MKIVSVIGARPEFVQAAPVSAALRGRHHEIVVNTGQHYDYLMSRVFMQELSIPEPNYNLEVGSGAHGKQTGEILARMEQVLLAEKPDWVIVRGDTNSTLAGGLAASKMGIPLAHIESGARSFDRAMPEEINRVVVDHIANLLFCIAPSGVENLANEGIRENVHYVGDVMCDALLEHQPLARAQSDILARHGLTRGGYVLATCHRAANTDDVDRLRTIAAALSQVNGVVVFPVHPRTRAALDRHGVTFGHNVLAIEPVGYRDMLALESDAEVIVTDSGGVTREAYLLGIPCVTLRAETEHVETVTNGWNRLVDAAPDRIREAVATFRPRGYRPPIFGDGSAATQIVEILTEARGGSVIDSQAVMAGTRTPVATAV